MLTTLAWLLLAAALVADLAAALRGEGTISDGIHAVVTRHPILMVLGLMVWAALALHWAL